MKSIFNEQMNEWERVWYKCRAADHTTLGSLALAPQASPTLTKSKAGTVVRVIICPLCMSPQVMEGAEDGVMLTEFLPLYPKTENNKCS